MNLLVLLSFVRGGLTRAPVRIRAWTVFGGSKDENVRAEEIMAMPTPRNIVLFKKFTGYVANSISSDGAGARQMSRKQSKGECYFVAKPVLWYVFTRIYFRTLPSTFSRCKRFWLTLSSSLSISSTGSRKLSIRYSFPLEMSRYHENLEINTVSKCLISDFSSPVQLRELCATSRGFCRHLCLVSQRPRARIHRLEQVTDE